MKTTKIIALIIALALLAAPVFVFSAAAEDIAADNPSDFDSDSIEPMPMPTLPVIDSESKPEYGFAEGIIEEIADGRIHVKTAESEFYAITDSSTYSITFGKADRRAIAAGDSIRVFYDITKPMAAIYPPQYIAEFIAVNLDKAYSVAIARFNEDLTDSKNSLKLNISDETEIILEDGIPFEGGAEELINRKLIVIYHITTDSIPAITIPEKIIVMYEKAVHPTLELTEEEIAEFLAVYEKADIVVNGEVIESPRAFMNTNGILMVPVRAIAESLGLPVEWFEDTRTVQIGKNLSFTIGQDAYSFARMAPVSLGTDPVIKDDRTFVPINLFAMLTGSEYVIWYLEDNQLIIDIPMK